MKKFLAIVLTLLMLVSLAGCMKKVQKIPISDLKSRDGLMLVIGTELGGSSDSEDRVVSIEHEIFWDGKITQTKHHSNSDDESWELDLSDDDYMKFYEFAESAYLNDTYRWVKKHHNSTTYTLDYYPAGGQGRVCLISGYSYGNEELSSAIELAESYFADFEPEPEYTIQELKLRDGVMAKFSVFDAGAEEDHKTVYVLQWRGSLDKYIYDKDQVVAYELNKASADDYMAIYNWCKEAYMEDIFADYSKDECDDGILWRILYNDPDKEPFEIYYGCICENEELSAMADLITSYFE